MEDAIFAQAREIVDRRTWGDIENDATLKRCHDTAIACLVDFIMGDDGTAFRRGVRATVQATVNDLAELVKRRHQAMANKDHTAVIAGIARRIAALPMPQSEDDLGEPMPREVLISKVARIIHPMGDWDGVTDLETMAEDLKFAWRFADEIVVLVRYA